MSKLRAMNRLVTGLICALILTRLTASAGLTGGTLDISGGNGRFPDVAYGNVSRRYLVVWAEYSASVRILGRLVNGDGTMPGIPFPVSDAGFASLFPAVAFNAANNEFLVTWDDGGDRGGVIFGQRVRGSDGVLLGGNFAIGSIYGGIRSAVAWSATSASYLVTYWVPGAGPTAREVYGQRVSAPGALLGGNFNISNDPDFFSGYPAVSWAPSGDQFLVTWDHAEGNDDGNIRGQRVSAATGGLLGSAIPVTTSGANDRSCIAFEPAGAHWLVQYNNRGNAGYSYDQYGQFVGVDGAVEGQPVAVAHTPAFEGDTQFGGDITFEPGAQRFFSSFGTDTGMGGQELLSSGSPLAGQVVIGTGFYTSLNNAADTEAHRFLTAWEGKPGNVYMIFGRLYAVPPAAVQEFAVVQGDTQNQLTWKNPDDPHFTGTMIRVKTGGHPTGPADGTLVVDKAGAPGAVDGFSHTGVTNWTTYYYAAFARDSGPNFSPAAQLLATPRPPAATVTSSDFAAGADGWTLDVWRSNATSGFGTVAWDAGSILSGGTGTTNTNDACTREGSTMTRLISAAGHANIQIEYEMMASLAPQPAGAPIGSCANLEGTREDKLVVFYSTNGTGGPWSAAQSLNEGVELPCSWTRRFINLAGVPGVANNPNFALKFQWQFNAAGDTGRVDNVRVLSGALTSLTPAISLAPARLERTEPLGGNPTPDILKVSNSGGGTLNFTVNDDAPWLTLTPANSSSNGPERAVSVLYNTAPLDVGDHRALVTISADTSASLTLPVTLHLLPPAQVWEPFTYYDGPLTTLGNANWSGSAGSESSLESGTLKITGGTGAVTAQRAATAAGSGGVIAAEIKITGGTGTGDIYWSIYLDDPAGNNLARWYGSSLHARGRIGSTITPDMILTGAWDDLYVEMDTALNTSAFYFNGTLYSIISHGTTPANSVATVRIERSDRPTAGADSVRFDNLHIGPVDATLPKLNYTSTASGIDFSWPAVRRGATLECTANPAPPTTWTSLTAVVANGQFTHTASMAPPRRFFRLRRP